MKRATLLHGLGGLLLISGLLTAGGKVAAQPAEPDPERALRRLELRQQLQAERGRWRAEGLPTPLGGSTEPGRAPPRLSPAERQDLRRELREARP